MPVALLSVPVVPRDASVFLHKLPDQRLPKSHLVRKGWEYQRIYREGKRLHGNGFSLVCLYNGSSVNRLGISVHRKIRGAVRRNRMKRIIREAFRTSRHSFPYGMDMVFTVRPDFSLQSPAEVISAVCELVGRRNDVL